MGFDNQTVVAYMRQAFGEDALERSGESELALERVHDALQRELDDYGGVVLPGESGDGPALLTVKARDRFVLTTATRETMRARHVFTEVESVEVGRSIEGTNLSLAIVHPAFPGAAFRCETAEGVSPAALGRAIELLIG